jgi:hypothetical protein
MWPACSQLLERGNPGIITCSSCFTPLQWSPSSCSASHFAHKLGPTTEATHQSTGCCWLGSPTFGFFSDWKGPPPLRSCSWGTGVPGCSHGQLCLEPAVFVTELRHRLGIPDAGDDAWCPQCNGILDRFSLHAGTCSAGGERTLRHHALRDTIYKWAERAGLQPEREKPGLLLKIFSFYPGLQFATRVGSF